MNTNSKTAVSIDMSEKWIYLVGGISAFVIFVGYILTFPLYLPMLPMPTGLEAQLPYFAENAANWWMVTALMVFTDLLYFPVWLAVYQALKGVSRNGMLMALICKFLFVGLDLAITWTAYTAMVILGEAYVAAGSDIQQVAITAAAGYPFAAVNSPLGKIYAILIPSLGTLIASFVMFKGVFNKATAYLALAVGLSAIVAVFGPFVSDIFESVYILNALLAAIWYLLVGYRLVQLGRRERSVPEQGIIPARQPAVEEGS